MRSYFCTVFAAVLFAGANASAAPFPPTPAVSPGATVNTAYTFTTNVHGGTGSQGWTFNLPGSGVYLATFAANFTVAGSTTSPIAYSCALLNGDANVVQSTALNAGDLGWDVGVSGSGIVNVKKGHLTLGINCGPGDNSAWTFADRPLEVTFVKLTGKVNGPLTSDLAHRTTAGMTH